MRVYLGRRTWHDAFGHLIIAGTFLPFGRGGGGVVFEAVPGAGGGGGAAALALGGTGGDQITCLVWRSITETMASTGTVILGAKVPL